MSKRRIDTLENPAPIGGPEGVLGEWTRRRNGDVNLRFKVTIPGAFLEDGLPHGWRRIRQEVLAAFTATVDTLPVADPEHRDTPRDISVGMG